MNSIETAVLFANDAFYATFAVGDVVGMDSLWSQSAPVSCIHPGGGILVGRDHVMDNWRAILESHNTDGIACADATAHVAGDMAWVTCFEVIEDGNGGSSGFLAATNVFVREGRTWKMVHHQAGPTTARPTAQPEPQKAVQ